MNRRTVVLVVILIAVALAGFVLPSMWRLPMVVSLGVVAADQIATAGTVLGVISLVAAAGLAALDVRRNLQLGRAAAKAELEAEQWEKLPSKNEVRREVVEPMLRQVAVRYPSVDPQVQESLRQLNSIHHVLDAVGDIFNVSPGMVTLETARYGSVEYLISDMLTRFYPGLIRIIYQAHVNASGNTEKLRTVIESVNHENQATVELVEEIGSGVAFSSTRSEGKELAREKFEIAIKQLYSNDDEKGPLSL